MNLNQHFQAFAVVVVWVGFVVERGRGGHIAAGFEC